MRHRLSRPAIAFLALLGAAFVVVPWGMRHGSGVAGAAAAAAQAPAEKPAPATDYLWFEAETPRRTNFPPIAQNPFNPANEREAAVLSGGRWIGTSGDRAETLFLEYDVAAPRAGTYQFYARKFWQHGPFRWRFDDQPWREVRNTALLDDAPIRQFLGANWVGAGAVTLTPGKHVLRVELLENKGAAAFDAFLLTTGTFVARGRLKPGEKYGRAPEGWFPFEPDPDPFAPSPIDLRPLNETFAGEHGFIRVRGEEFVHGATGKPVRFWAINTGNETLALPPPPDRHDGPRPGQAGRQHGPRPRPGLGLRHPAGR
jgi:hypothetical protein